MKTGFIAATVLAGTLAFSSASFAAVVDFNSAMGAPDGYVDQGVTFTWSGTGGAPFYSNSPAGSRAQVMSGDDDSFWRADIAGGATSVSVDLGDFNADADRIFLSIFDSLDSLLGTTTYDLEASFIGMHTLSLFGANIAYATYGTTGELGLGGILSDNFTYTAGQSAVPIPAAVLMFGPALLGFLGFRRKARA